MVKRAEKHLTRLGRTYPDVNASKMNAFDEVDVVEVAFVGDLVAFDKGSSSLARSADKALASEQAFAGMGTIEEGVVVGNGAREDGGTDFDSYGRIELDALTLKEACRPCQTDVVHCGAVKLAATEGDDVYSSSRKKSRWLPFSREVAVLG